jgi:hypothetical protein
MTNSSKRLLLLAVSVMALMLAFAPVSFAGEDDGSGPTQVGEIAAPTAPAPATQTAPAAPVAAAPTSSTSSSSSHSSSAGGVKGVSKTIAKKDTVVAKGGIQAGFGGMATQSTSLPMTLAFAGGILFLLAATAGFAPLARRSQD